MVARIILNADALGKIVGRVRYHPQMPIWLISRTSSDGPI